MIIRKIDFNYKVTYKMEPFVFDRDLDCINEKMRGKLVERFSRLGDGGFSVRERYFVNSFLVDRSKYVDN